MSEKKKIVDLIFLDPPEKEQELINGFKLKIRFWLGELEGSSTNYLEQNFEIGSIESLEYMEVINMKQFIKHFIEKRLHWIENSVTDPVLRRRYLTLLPPFPHQAGIKRLLIHFFQAVETSNKQGIKVVLKSEEEKETNILWDVYKLLKTVESAETILKNLNSESPFASVFPLEYRKKCIANTRIAAFILFRKFIRPEKQALFSKGMPKSIFSAEALEERKESNDLLIQADMIENLNYRNFFFSFFYFPSVRAKIGGKLQKVNFNYLDFELIKQEFLFDWINNRLNNNPEKFAIYEKYMIGDQSLAKLIRQDPYREIEYLQKLPLSHFDDMMAQINSKVDPDLKTKVTPFSENHGPHSYVLSQFKKAIELTRSPITTLRNIISPQKNREEFNKDLEDLDRLKDSLDEELTDFENYEFFSLEKNDIDFPFFHSNSGQFARKLMQLRTTMDPELFGDFSQDLKNTLSEIDPSLLLKRKKPVKEWVLPYLIKDMHGKEPFHHLLLLGAEIKIAQVGNSYTVGETRQEQLDFSCYFVYATDKMNPLLGDPVSTRFSKGIELHEYNCTNKEVQKLAVELSQKVIDQL